MPASAQTKNNKSKEVYKCIPCGYECDKELYSKPGKCSKCQMELVQATTIKFKQISPAEICDYIKKHPNIVLLDVRTREEFEGKANPDFGTLKNAINLPVQELESKIATIAQFKKREILVYCSHSHRSPQASYILNQHGFTNVTNMEGGMSVMQQGDCIK